MNTNFEVIGLKRIKTQAIEIFESMIKDWKVAKNEYNNIYNSIIPTDEDIDKEILRKIEEVEEFINDADGSFNSLMLELDAYIEQTVVNEKKALKELDEFDEELARLSEETEEMITRINSIKIEDNDITSTTIITSVANGEEPLSDGIEILDNVIIGDDTIDLRGSAR